MLVTTDYPLSQIAQQFGFSDVKYMSKSFKKVKGQTPMEYKRNALANGPMSGQHRAVVLRSNKASLTSKN